MAGEELVGLAPYRIANRGVGYTPQGRRLWPSLTVNEHLRLAWTGSAAWTVDRIYDTFPRLAERRDNGGGQLSGGEQQMLADFPGRCSAIPNSWSSTSRPRGLPRSSSIRSRSCWPRWRKRAWSRSC